MRTLQVELGARSYPIHIGVDLGAGDALRSERGVRALLVSDSHVAPLHAGEWARRLRRNGLDVIEAVVPAGEASKSLSCAMDLYRAAVEGGLDRRSVVVALGGGMVGDLAGFVAATFLRGIRLIQIPTSLLAMVDSSVGGKTAVDLPQGKNLVGVFHQPVEVVADVAMLVSLPEREYLSGFGEVVKYGVIRSAEFFMELERKVEALRGRDPGVLQDVIARCCAIKAEVVAADERESGVRAILNFGHTCGHALEQATGYGRWLHGEAVALGMRFAAALSVAERAFPAEEAERLDALLERLGLPTTLEASSGTPAWSEVRAAMASDKKTLSGVPRFVLADRLGSVAPGCEAGEDQLAAAWRSIGYSIST